MKRIIRFLILYLFVSVSVFCFSVSSNFDISIPKQMISDSKKKENETQEEYKSDFISCLFNNINSFITETKEIVKKEIKKEKEDLKEVEVKPPADDKNKELDSNSFSLAVYEMREHFIKRDKEFEISFSYNDNDELTGNIAQKLYDAAIRHTGIGNEGDYIVNNIRKAKIYGQNKILDNVNQYTLTVTADYATTLEQEKNIESALSTIHIVNDNMTQEEKARAIYDFIIDHVAYKEYGDISHTAYAALIKKQAVCQGYAMLFYRMALDAGINTRIITGTGITDKGEEPHAWNIIEIDGEWYNIDATWGESNKDKYFMANTKEFQRTHIKGESTDK